MDLSSRIMNVTLRQLEVFRSVALTRNFSRSGQLIGLTQPAVSRCITELEAQLGLKLLNRTTREVELTEAGRRWRRAWSACWRNWTTPCSTCRAWPPSGAAGCAWPAAPRCRPI
jgi:hypothetical protein